jgi:hypothetical protein
VLGGGEQVGHAYYPLLGLAIIRKTVVVATHVWTSFGQFDLTTWLQVPVDDAKALLDNHRPAE